MIGGQQLDLEGGDAARPSCTALKTGRALLGLGDVRRSGRPSVPVGRAPAVARVRRRARAALPDRRRHPRRRRLRARGRRGRCPRLADEAAERAHARLAAIDADTRVLAEIVDELAVAHGVSSLTKPASRRARRAQLPAGLLEHDDLGGRATASRRSRSSFAVLQISTTRRRRSASCSRAGRSPRGDHARGGRRGPIGCRGTSCSSQRPRSRRACRRPSRRAARPATRPSRCSPGSASSTASRTASSSRLAGPDPGGRQRAACSRRTRCSA